LNPPAFSWWSFSEVPFPPELKASGIGSVTNYCADTYPSCQ
jgi:hypothetical protein